MVLAGDDWLAPDSFQLAGVSEVVLSPGEQIMDGYSIKSAQKLMEREMIVKALKATQGNRTQAARLLEISHPSLLSKLKTYDIDM